MSYRRRTKPKKSPEAVGCTILVIQLMPQVLGKLTDLPLKHYCMKFDEHEEKERSLIFISFHGAILEFLIDQPQRHGNEIHKTRVKLQMVEDSTRREVIFYSGGGGCSNLHVVSAVFTDAAKLATNSATTLLLHCFQDHSNFPGLDPQSNLQKMKEYQVSLLQWLKASHFHDGMQMEFYIYLSSQTSERCFDIEKNIAKFPFQETCKNDEQRLVARAWQKVITKAFSEDGGEGEDERRITPSQRNEKDSLDSEEFSLGFQEPVEIKNSSNGEGTHTRNTSLDADGEDADSNGTIHIPERDGSIYDRARDPPGQRSVYVPPGNEKQESYRLSTFSKFPPDVPVIPRDLAAAGFYYTGYKDRVKCFSCGLAVENWVVGDDVKHARWHKTTCDFIIGRNSGNIPIGGGLFSRFFTRAPGSNVPESSGSRQPAPSQPAPSQAQAPQEAPEPMEEGNLNVVSTHSATPVPLPPPSYLGNDFRYAEMPSIEHSNYVKSLDLKYERNRRLTFRNWLEGDRTVSTNELAKSGFFYLGNLDRVQCFSCGGVLRNWTFGDIVDNEHRRHFSHCRMLRGVETMNIPILNEERPAAVGVVQEPADPDPNLVEGLREMFPCIDPVSPHMRDEARRLETFDQRWPNRIAATPAQIAKAGFFFLGERDRVKCWYCNGGLQNWDVDDEPWSEHAKWFPTCEFILQKKGPDFVHRIVARFPNLRRPVIQRPYDIPPDEELGRRQPSPPPAIIDPQADERRLIEKVDAAMRSQVARSVVQMGYSENNVKRALKRKIRNSRVEFGTVAELLDALENHEYSDDEEAPAASPNVNITNVSAQNVVIGNRSLTNTAGSLQLSAREATAVKQTPSAPASITPMDVEMSGTASVSSNEEQTPSMARRLRELQEERICKVCLDKPADMVFVPCGHLCCCYNCASSVRKCPVCRKKIDQVIRTYMS